MANDEPTNPLTDRFAGRVLNLGEIVKVPKPEFLVQDVLPRQGTGVLYGPPKSAKTFVALALVLSIATGRPWLGHKILFPGSTLYIAAEGAGGIGVRVNAWLIHHECDPEHPAIFLPTAIQLLDGASVGALVDLVCNRLPPDCRLIVLDTLARSMVGGDENTAKDMGIVISAVDIIARETAAFVLLVHHTGKNLEAGMRGSSALLGAVDTAIEIAGDSTAFRVAISAQKDAELIPPWWCALHPVAGSVVPVCANSDREATAATLDAYKVLGEIATHTGVPTSWWEKACGDAGISRPSFYRARKWLVEKDWVSNLGSDRQPRYLRKDQLTPE